MSASQIRPPFSGSTVTDKPFFLSSIMSIYRVIRAKFFAAKLSERSRFESRDRRENHAGDATNYEAYCGYQNGTLICD